MRDRKTVPLRDVKEGTKFDIIKGSGFSTMASYELVKQQGIFAIVKLWGEKEERISTENTFVEIELTEEEIKNKYFDKAKEIAKNLQNKIPFNSSYIGYHEMWNSWIDPDPYQMASNCEYENIKILGICDLDEDAKEIGDYLILDIGIIAETKSGNKFWCHANSKWFNDEEWLELLK